MLLRLSLTTRPKLLWGYASADGRESLPMTWTGAQSLTKLYSPVDSPDRHCSQAAIEAWRSSRTRWPIRCTGHAAACPPPPGVWSSRLWLPRCWPHNGSIQNQFSSGCRWWCCHRAHCDGLWVTARRLSVGKTMTVTRNSRVGGAKKVSRHTTTIPKVPPSDLHDRFAIDVCYMSATESRSVDGFTEIDRKEKIQFKKNMFGNGFDKDYIIDYYWPP